MIEGAQENIGKGISELETADGFLRQIADTVLENQLRQEDFFERIKQLGAVLDAAAARMDAAYEYHAAAVEYEEQARDRLIMANVDITTERGQQLHDLLHTGERGIGHLDTDKKFFLKNFYRLPEEKTPRNAMLAVILAQAMHAAGREVETSRDHVQSAKNIAESYRI